MHLCWRQTSIPTISLLPVISVSSFLPGPDEKRHADLSNENIAQSRREKEANTKKKETGVKDEDEIHSHS